jgi:hypothetical protein
MNALRQQMDESNHDMVNALTQQIGTVFNPVLQTANDNYLLLANQMGRMADFFGAPDAPNNQRVPRANPEIQPEVQAQPLRIEREQSVIPLFFKNRIQHCQRLHDSAQVGSVWKCIKVARGDHVKALTLR